MSEGHGDDVSVLDDAGISESVTRTDGTAKASARELLGGLGPTAGSLGRLQDLWVWLAGAQGSCPPEPLERVRLVALAGDHGIAAADVSARPAGDTARAVRETLAGRSATAVLAENSGVGVRVAAVAVDDPLGDVAESVTRWTVRRGSGRIDREDALTADETAAALRAGMALADEEVDSGADLLVLCCLSVAGSTAASALVGLFTRSDASMVTGRGSGVDDAGWMRKCAAVRDAMRRGRPVRRDPVALVATIGGADLAAATGFLLQAAVRRTPVLLDGLMASAAALLAHRHTFRAADWWVAGHRSPEPAHSLALTRLSLDPLLDLGVAADDGVGALLAVPVLRAAAALPVGRA